MLFYREKGPQDGAPVLFLHAGSYTGTMWDDIADRLPTRRVILPDLPGHGQSRDIALSSLENAADAVADLIEQTNGDRPVDLVGLSFGGYVGLMLMARHPARVRRAMLSGIQLGAIPNPVAVNLFIALLSPLILLRRFRKKMAEQMGITDPRVFERADGSANLSPRTLRRVGSLGTVFNVHDLLPSIPVPTLMIAGGREHDTIRRSTTAYQERMPDCRAAIVPGLGHAWCRQDPDLFAETVRAWMEAAPLPDGIGDAPGETG